MTTRKGIQIPTGNERGMTLLELAVVLLILVTLATVALRSTTGLQEQARFEQTQNRYDAIKAAIIGDPNLTINGQTDISGFVADMGRLPNNIHELLVREYCGDDYAKDISSCSAPANEVRQTDVVYSTTLGVYGWNGPYLSTSQNDTDGDAFTDGWGNESINLADQNYGWIVTSQPTMFDLQTNGCGSCSLSEYNALFPADATAITQFDWKIPVNTGVNISIRTPANGSCSSVNLTNGIDCTNFSGTWDGMNCSTPTVSPTTKNSCEALSGTWTPTPKDICLKIYFRELLSGNTVINDPAISDHISINEDGREHLISFNGFDNSNGVINAIPMGINSLAVYEYDIGSSTCTSTTYPNSGANSIKVTFIPNNMIPTVFW